MAAMLRIAAGVVRKMSNTIAKLLNTISSNHGREVLSLIIHQLISLGWVRLLRIGLKLAEL